MRSKRKFCASSEEGLPCLTWRSFRRHLHPPGVPTVPWHLVAFPGRSDLSSSATPTLLLFVSASNKKDQVGDRLSGETKER